MPIEPRESCLKDFEDSARSTEFSRVFGPLNHLWYLHLAAVIKRHAPDSARVLDLGTGPAHLIHFLCRLYPRSHIMGIDHSLPMLNIARSRKESPQERTQTSLIQGDFYQLPFGNHSFDLVTATGILHHVEALPAFFREAHRVVAPGGQFIATAFRRDVARMTRIFSQVHSKWLAFTGSDLEGLYCVIKSSWTKHEVEDALAEVGFRTFTVEVRRLWLWVVASA
jgi:ubiquinone/menaquinone biosynthesis C-methylase UbiE